MDWKAALNAMIDESPCIIKLVVFTVLSVLTLLFFILAVIPEYICYWPQIVLLGVSIICLMLAIWFITLDF